MASDMDPRESRNGADISSIFHRLPARSTANAIELTPQKSHQQHETQAAAAAEAAASATASIAAAQQQQQRAPSTSHERIWWFSQIDSKLRARLIKYAQALGALAIFTLLIVILTLVIVSSLSNGATRASQRTSKLLEQISDKLKADKLISSSSDDHFTMHSPPPDSLADPASDPDQDHQPDHGSGDADQSNQVVPARNRQQQQVDDDRGNRRPGKKRDPDAICMTPGCVRAAAQILNNMDNGTRPCDDFYQFACGRWIATQVIPDEKTSLSVFSQNTADLNVRLRALIERPQREEDPPIVGQMRNMYASCMNLSDIEARGDEPLLDVLRDLGGWPVLTVKTINDARNGEAAAAAATTSARPTSGRLETPASSTSSTGGGGSTLGSMLSAGGQQQERRRRNGQQAASRAVSRRQAADESGTSTAAPPGGEQRAAVNGTSWSASSFSWLETLFKFRARGFSHDMIIDLSVTPDVRNSRRYIIELDQSSLGLPDRSYYFKGMQDTTVSAYYNQMVESAVMLGAPRAEARKQMLEALEFETSLAKISVPREQRRNVSRLYNKMAARELHKLAPGIDWPRYLRTLLRDDQLDMDTDEVIVKVPSFLRQLDVLLASTEPRVLANYMIWRIVRHSMNGLGRKWRELAHSFSTVTTGRQIEEPRWEQCLGSIDNTLGLALSALYVKNHFNERSKAAALEMVEYIREEFLRVLEEIDWMDEETREEAKQKAYAIASYIGYPDELLRDELVEEMYAGVKMARTNFYQNIRSLRVWSTNYAFAHLRKPNKRGDWKKHARAAVVNAYYNSLENSIEFPAGILQGAFFDAERPNYMNFGAIGYVIGHEITHGFDDRGRQFDKDGNDRNWWKPKTDARFKERAQCIIEQYGNFTIPEQGLRVNGLNTQGENIADNGGIKESFRAYRRWTKDHGREARLPGLEYTPDQLFWISAANIWCGKFRPEVLKLRINSGVHSPARFRVIGPLSNSHEFAQSFNCPLGSPMNPRKKCSVW